MDQFEKELAEAAIQGSELWVSERKGLFTASENHRLMSDPRSKADPFSDGAYTYIMEKVAEEITGEEKFTPDTWDMKYGKETEPIARIKFGTSLTEKGIIATVDEPGFFPYLMNGIKVAGASPDGRIFINEMILPTYGLEIKCPSNPANHIEYCLIDSAEYMKKYFKNHYWQIQTGMMATGLDKWFFVSYHPKVKGLELFSIIIDKNPADIAELEKRIWNADQEKKRVIKLLTKQALPELLTQKPLIVSKKDTVVSKWLENKLDNAEYNDLED